MPTEEACLRSLTARQAGYGQTERLHTAPRPIDIECALVPTIGIDVGGRLRRRRGQPYSGIDRDNIGGPFRLFPFTRPNDLEQPSLEAPRSVVIDPSLAFGRPVAMKKAIRTATIAERFNLGESISSLADDYAMTVQDVEEALRYERRPRTQAA